MGTLCTSGLMCKFQSLKHQVPNKFKNSKLKIPNSELSTQNSELYLITSTSLISSNLGSMIHLSGIIDHAP